MEEPLFLLNSCPMAIDLQFLYLSTGHAFALPSARHSHPIDE